MKRYIVAILVILIIMLGGILLLSSNKSDSTDKKAADKPAATTQKQLHDYADSVDSRVVFTTQGRIVGDDQFRSIRITVGRDYRRIEVLDSYTQQVQRSQDFANNQTAYDTFLRSLESAGFRSTLKTTLNDERGQCPNGQRYIYEVLDGATQVQRTWSSNCGAKVATFGGNAATVQRLFQGQITGYNDFIRGVQLS